MVDNNIGNILDSYVASIFGIKDDGSKKFIDHIKKYGNRYSDSRQDEIGELSNNPVWQKGYTHFGRVKETFGNNLPKLKSGTILDWGCSIGYTTNELSLLYPKCNVVGLDCSEFNISRANYNPHIDRTSFVCGDGYNLDKAFPDVCFDMIVMMNNIWHISYNFSDEELKNIFSSISKRIINGGYLMISADISNIVLKKNADNFDILSAESNAKKTDLNSKTGTSYRLLKVIDESCLERALSVQK